MKSKKNRIHLNLRKGEGEMLDSLYNELELLNESLETYEIDSKKQLLAQSQSKTERTLRKTSKVKRQ
ncbi:hypothetical protein ACFFK0_25605 [Paenibacillus chartarius]|uniref:Uncharacterized protein n=1 Tax=Paenibacillus chartarius TaxID=747481 RepID=A0ABV6DTB4_9BACL